MGSSSSKPSSSGSTSRIKRTKQKLSSIFLCGSSSSSSYIPLEFEDHPVKSALTSVENFGTLSRGSPSSITESSSIFWSEAVNASDNNLNGTSSGSCIGITEDDLLDRDLINLEVLNNASLPNNGETNSHQPSQESVPTLVAVADLQISEEESVSFKCSGSKQSSSMDQDHFRGQGDVSHHIPETVAVPIPSDRIEVNHIPETSGSVQERIREDMFHVDRLSISSNMLSSGTPDLSNSRRLFWDSFSRRRSRRHSDSPTILFTSGRSDDLGSRDRWHRNLDGVHFGAGHQSGGNLGMEALRNERRWMGSEISDRLLSTLSEFDQQATLCASGLHPRGTCTCESLYTAEEFSALASISRIITLAETLFEVLEELYRQPFSFSPSMPAPESLVDSFPVKYYKTPEATGSSAQNDLPQCYICLSEYEDGEQLRVLPCHHEYHMSCIDKWLKEINRVCPLCRHNICEDSAQATVSNTEVSLQ